MNIKKAHSIIEQHTEAIKSHYDTFKKVDYKNREFVRKNNASNLTFKNEMGHQRRGNTLGSQKHSADTIRHALLSLINADDEELKRHGIINTPNSFKKVDKLPKKQETQVRF